MIDSHVIRRERVVLSTDVFSQVLKSARGQMLVALKHHVFEEMSKAAAAIRIIFRTDVIPNLDSDSRALVIFDRVDLEAVVERSVFERKRRNRDRLSRSRTLGADE